MSLKISHVPVRPSLVITTGGVAVAPSSKSEITPGLTAQPLRPGGTTAPPAAPALPTLPELPALPGLPPLPAPLLPPAPAPAAPLLIVTQTLLWQAWFAAHAMPQAPQLAALTVVSAQTLPQVVVPVGQLEVHVLFAQNAVGALHTLPQVPQF
jgi:hypothetical protein